MPLRRKEFHDNEIPITPIDIRALHQVHGEEVAENVRIAAQQIRRNGGVNPNTRDVVYPDTIEGSYEESELLRVVSNFAVWYTLNHEPYNYSQLM